MGLAYGDLGAFREVEKRAIIEFTHITQIAADYRASYAKGIQSLIDASRFR